MAGDWIKIEGATPDKPEVWGIAAALDIDPDAAFGKLFRVWSWFDQHTENGNAPSVTKKLLDRSVGVTGFCDAMVEAGWLIEEGGDIQIPKFDRHNGKTAKNRALNAKRVANHKRQGNGSGNDPVTVDALPREEKRREEGNSRRGAPAPTESAKDYVWRVGVDLLTSTGTKESAARSFLGKLCREHGDEAVREAVGRAVTVAPAEPKAWLQGAVKNQNSEPFLGDT